VQSIADARLVCHLADQLNVALAVTRQPKMQLILECRKLGCAAQRVIDWTKLGKKPCQLLCENRGIDFAAKSISANPNLCEVSQLSS